MSGPILSIPAQVVRVIDGDTCRVRATNWLPGHTIETTVRIAGIDTPETKQRAKSKVEADLGAKAKQFAIDQFTGAIVSLVGIESDKYGRILTKVVRHSDGACWAGTLVAAGLAKAYDGGTKCDWTA